MIKEEPRTRNERIVTIDILPAEERSDSQQSASTSGCDFDTCADAVNKKARLCTIIFQE
jgi:hypothetical protein